MALSRYPRSKGRADRGIEPLPSFCRVLPAFCQPTRREVSHAGCERPFAHVCAPTQSSVDIPVDLNLDGNSLLVSLLIGCVGFVCFAYGKRQQRLPQMVAGVLLCVYPYFVSNLMLMAAIAVAILVLLGVAVRLGA
jgi:hypothetical protein